MNTDMNPLKTRKSLNEICPLIWVCVRFGMQCDITEQACDEVSVLA